ncbi:MAG: transglutaminase domain-containing protein [Lachnospiraceae bacterium]|nr:transglutaminase domain-containing protein [Lachnospiraceae bacterium]
MDWKYEDMEERRIGLPQDVRRMKEYGDFEGAKRRIAVWLEKEIPEALRKRLKEEIPVLEILPMEYTIPKEQAILMCKERIRNFTEEEFERRWENGEIDWIYVNGEVRFFRRFLETLLKVFIPGKRVKDETSDVDELEQKALEQVVHKVKEKGKVTYHFRIHAGIKVKEVAFEKGMLSVHIPYPLEQMQVHNVRLVESNIKEPLIASRDAGQRTVFGMVRQQEPEEIYIEYEYDNSVRYVVLDPKKAEASIQPVYTWALADGFADAGPVRKEDFLEQAPHIIFTPYLKALAEEIVGEETNIVRKAKMVYDFVTTKIKYSFMPEYVVMDSIAEYAAMNGRGDCGVQTILFITLLRILGIPARWQSGLYVTPYSAGSHDWAQFYVEPYGWVFADCSFGGSAYRRGEEELWEFYFGNLDPFRMPANSVFQQEFYPRKKYRRTDPFDNQRGEAEYEDRGLSYDELECCRRVIAAYEKE